MQKSRPKYLCDYEMKIHEVNKFTEIRVNPDQIYFMIIIQSKIQNNYDILTQ